MRKTIFVFMVLCFCFASDSWAGQYGGYGDVHVNGYHRNDGAYVQPHYRTQPDGDEYNNYSYKEPNFYRPEPIQPQQRLGGDSQDRLGPRNQKLGTGNSLGW